MSNHNYSQYSSKNKPNHNKPNKPNNQQPKPVEKIPVPEVKPEVKPKPQFVQETVDTVKLPATVEGFVVNCAKLNVRENATVNSGIVCVLDAMSEIEVDVNRSTSNWVYVYTATGAEGYCMRQYIDAHL